TGLPLINYLPDRLALGYARRFSTRVSREESWQTLLREGIRGGTVGEILGRLGDRGGRPLLLRPNREGLGDWVDLWDRGYGGPADGSGSRLKRWAMPFLKVIFGVTGW